MSRLFPLKNEEGEERYVALSYSEKEHLLEKRIIEYCGQCECYHPLLGVQWEAVENALSEEIKEVEEPSPSEVYFSKSAKKRKP